MTHAHFSKYPISDLSHPKVARCRTMGTHKGDLSRNLHQLSERVRLFLLVHLVLWYCTVMGLNNAFFYRDASPLP